ARGLLHRREAQDDPPVVRQADLVEGTMPLSAERERGPAPGPGIAVDDLEVLESDRRDENIIVLHRTGPWRPEDERTTHDRVLGTDTPLFLKIGSADILGTSVSGGPSRLSSRLGNRQPAPRL